MEEKHVKEVHVLLTEYLKKFDLHPEFTVDEIRHWLLPRDEVVYAFVIEKDGKVTDMCSFYSLPSSILDNEKYSHLRAAYAYWHVPNTVPIDVLMNESLIQAKKLDFDVFNALDVMENDTALKALKFGIGDGFLQYYLYNWKTALIQPNQIGLVLL
jgi:glycylpeptide N-tetradecanoyltransferase